MHSIQSRLTNVVEGLQIRHYGENGIGFAGFIGKRLRNLSSTSSCTFSIQSIEKKTARIYSGQSPKYYKYKYIHTIHTNIHGYNLQHDKKYVHLLKYYSSMY